MDMESAVQLIALTVWLAFTFLYLDKWVEDKLLTEDRTRVECFQMGEGYVVLWIAVTWLLHQAVAYVI